jgi:hypothetical protein
VIFQRLNGSAADRLLVSDVTPRALMLSRYISDSVTKMRPRSIRFVDHARRDRKAGQLLISRHLSRRPMSARPARSARTPKGVHPAMQKLTKL